MNQKRLRKGDVIVMQKREWLIETVTESAAKARLLGRKKVTIDDREFMARETRVTHISPYSQVEVIRREKL